MQILYLKNEQNKAKNRYVKNGLSGNSFRVALLSTRYKITKGIVLESLK